ncbi:MAG: hypothetical protein OQJ89_12270 [Kangiellaceae bacterium]|nr:hypothetical protein [Kangiellaceae bacterium]MCW8997223.1 hypothetical protein [Kangiellaceae bacterium]MCW9017736.1 hypothetical protein [Kangiellaceae bacterium]
MLFLVLVRLTFALTISLSFSCFVSADPSAPSSYPQIMTLEQLNQIKTRLKGKRHLMVLWSLDCPPCFKELELIGTLAKKQPNLPITIFNVDQDIDVDEVYQEISSKYGLSLLPHFFISEEQYEQVKYALDPTWYGELPRSYFIKKDGVWVGKSGLLSKKQIKGWFY